MTLNLTIKTLGATVGKITVESSNTIESELGKIKESVGFTESNVRLLHVGKVLDTEKTFDEYKIKNNDFLIIMRSPVKKEQPPKPIETPVVAPEPAPVHTVPPPAPPVQTQQVNQFLEFWTHAPPEQTAPNFSIEQFHVILPVIFSYLLQNPHFTMSLLTSPQNASTILLSQSLRPVIIQLLNQSEGILHSLRTGTSTNFSVNVTTPNNLQQNTNDESSDEHDQEQEDDYEDNDDNNYDNQQTLGDALGIGTTLNVGNPNNLTNMIQSLMQPQASNVPSQNEEADLQELMTVTGMPMELVRQIYNQCGKNVNVAASMLFQMMDG